MKNVRLELTITSAGEVLGSYLHPQIKMEKVDIDSNTEESLVKAATDMIRTTFAAARMIGRAQEKLEEAVGKEAECLATKPI